MNNKKFFILVAIVFVVVAAVIVFALVFSVSSADVETRRFDGTIVTNVENAPTPQDVLDICKGNNVFILDKEELKSKLNEKNRNWYAFDVKVEFPNVVTVYFVENVTMAKVSVGGQEIFIDSFGYVMDTPSNASDYIDISSAFSNTGNAKQIEVGKKLVFSNDEDNQRLEYVTTALMALWRCKLDFDDISVVVGNLNVFVFSNDDLILNMPSGAKIVVKSPENNLSDRLINGLSVYYSDNDLQRDGVVVNVLKNGITTEK